MYHLVSAVVLGFTTSIFTEGRIWGASPPCYIAIYFMTIGPLFFRGLEDRCMHWKKKWRMTRGVVFQNSCRWVLLYKWSSCKMQSISIVYVWDSVDCSMEHKMNFTFSGCGWLYLLMTVWLSMCLVQSFQVFRHCWHWSLRQVSPCYRAWCALDQIIAEH